MPTVVFRLLHLYILSTRERGVGPRKHYRAGYNRGARMEWNVENAALSVVNAELQLALHEADIQHQAAAHHAGHRHSEAYRDFNEAKLYQKRLYGYFRDEKITLTRPVDQSSKLTRYVRKMLNKPNISVSVRCRCRCVSRAHKEVEYRIA